MSSIWASIISGVVTIATVLITSYFGNKKVSGKVDDVHAAVNSTSESLVNSQARTEQLTAALTANNVDVPVSPNQ